MGTANVKASLPTFVIVVLLGNIRVHLKQFASQTESD
jgi:hypothetical protein